MNFRRDRHIRPYLIILIIVATLIIPASQFMVIRVEEDSMTPTLVDGQWILVVRGAQRVEAGDLAIFLSPADSSLAVKRCILEEGARPVVDHGWLVTPWGRWFLSGTQWENLNIAGRIPDDSVYLVGDNQFRSMDSRSYGSVPRRDLIGKVLLPKQRRNHG